VAQDDEMAKGQLVRRTSEGKIAGVCAGLGHYFDMDPVLFRVLFVAVILFGGSGGLIYLLLWLVMPDRG
jgi:phage shock protein PspC (stress-responsive transcriptional regulator)